MACFRGNREEFYGEVLLLDDTKITLKPEQGIKKSTKVSAILEQVFCHLNVVDVKFFGLRFCDKKQHTNWLDTSKTLSQHRSLPGPPYIFYFGVKFYAKDPVKLKDEGTRRQFYLQLRQDIRRRCLLVPYYLRPRLFALMMQVELGDFTDGEIVETEENRETLVIYKSMRGVSRPQAESLFLALSSSLPMYGVSLFNAYGGNQSEYFLGPSPVGIDVYKNRALVGKYLWQKITKLHFKNDTFELRVAGKQDSETTFFFHSPECKRLWKTCVEHHVFFRMSESDPPRLTHSSVTSSPALSLPRLNVNLRRHRSDVNTTTTTTATKEAENTTQSEGSKPVKKLTAPPAVDRSAGRAREDNKRPSAPWENSSTVRGLFNPGFPLRDVGRPQRRSRSLDGDQPIRHQRRRAHSRGTNSSGSESEKTSVSSTRQRRRKNRHSPDVVTWQHIQKQLVESSDSVTRHTEEIPYVDVSVSARDRPSTRRRRRRQWASATELCPTMALVPALPVTKTSDTSCRGRSNP